MTRVYKQKKFSGIEARRARFRAAQRKFRAKSPYVGRRAVSGELKFFDTTHAQATVATAGAITNASLNLIPQGVTESNRVGRKCTIKKIHFRGEVRMPDSSTSGTTADRMRMIVYVDKQANGATAAVTDILETANIDAFRDLSNTGRFTVLYDVTEDVYSPSGSGRGTTDTLAFGEMKKTLRHDIECSYPLEFSSTAGALTELRSNNVGVLAISEAGVVTLQYTARIRFTD